MLEAGAVAPTFDLPDQTGERVRLADYQGRWLAFWWYPEAGSEGCSVQAGSLTSRAADFTNLNVDLVGVSFNTVDKNNTFSCDYAVPFPLLSDVDRTIGRAYGVVRQPGEPFSDKPRRATFIIDPGGRIAFAEVVPPADLTRYAERLLDQAKNVLQQQSA